MKLKTISLTAFVLAISLNLLGQSDIIIVLKEQAELSHAQHLYTKQQRGEYVFQKTKELARRTQAPFVEMLQGREYQSFHVVNAIAVKDADEALISQLAQHPAVDYLQEDNPIPLTDYQRADTPPANSRTPEWGLVKIGVPEVWNMGVTGEGVTIAGQDTGYDWTHPALQATYRGWDGSVADHNYHWHDAIHELHPNNPPEENPCGVNSPEPCDDHSHGTHTMGTMTGEAPDEQIGVAPGANWIACRNMERGFGTPSSYIECFEWFLAPTDLNGENPDVSKSPHVINNSWACPEFEGCNPDNFNTMQIVVDNLKASGVVVVVSAGNSGNECSTINAPASIFENSFTVGASDQVDSLAGFSSRGPVLVDGSLRMKPNVSAPGVGVRSSVLNGGYSSYSGTSMAGPHVAGVVALMISANPALAGQVEEIETILEQTAIPLNDKDDECDGTSGTDIPNPIFGYGRIDAFAAVNAAMSSSTSNLDIQTLLTFPNPTTGDVRIQLPQQGGAIVRLWSADGRLVHQTNQSPSLDIRLDLSPFGNAVFLYEVVQDGQKWRGKLVKM
jgi:subtilisin family serine protease